MSKRRARATPLSRYGVPFLLLCVAGYFGLSAASQRQASTRLAETGTRSRGDRRQRPRALAILTHHCSLWAANSTQSIQI